MPQFKRGLRAVRPGAIKFRFSDYVNKSALPPLPHVFGFMPPASQAWGMDGNDQAGDCVIAGFCHSVMLWRMAAGAVPPVFSAKSALADYSRALVASGEAPYDPNDPSTDNGLDMEIAARWFRNTGITDANGGTHQIKAYADAGTLENLLYGAFLFGAAGIGLDLPDSAEDQFSRGQPWDDTSSPSSGGHYVPVVGRNSYGNLVIVTWGQLHSMTPAFAGARMMASLVLFSKEYLNSKTALSPAQFDEAQLDRDLAEL
jgi:hypothetical protein